MLKVFSTNNRKNIVRERNIYKKKAPKIFLQSLILVKIDKKNYGIVLISIMGSKNKAV